MTHDELFDLAEKVGLGFIRHASTRERDKFELFTKLVAEHERDAIAQMIEGIDGWNMDDPSSTAAKAIRARSGL